MSDRDTKFMLDTSALLAFIEAENGSKRVFDLLAEHETYISSIALLELRYITLQERGQAEADQRYALLNKTRAHIVWDLDERTLLTAARFKAAHRISLGDAIIAAMAAQIGATLLHKDPEYEALKGEVSLESLPYKR